QLIPTGELGPALLADTQQQDCLACLAELNKITDGLLSADLQAYHLRQAIAALDSTQGRELAEQTLDKLFSSFCIGK
ncbi:MAG: hypothetical protein LBV04_06795, partial [Deferribacteraceae bacterium]|nr:hypothetical protein [Deferribacteraceae bacterium]